ncbi:hypothetical protein [Andreprevotia chitinilytica]|uniref:hypothetical protein n=1 Tax=Andreprevotia chitinilytica TaxID=396808 RepID=UPI0005556ADD|nr:hypothetical protein [Andreprevotia chitinilytica]
MALMLGAIAMFIGLTVAPLHGAETVTQTPIQRAWSTPDMKRPSTTPNEHSVACGDGYCDGRAMYCETIKTDVAAIPSEHMCRPLPNACVQQIQKGVLSCGCFPAGTRCDFCGQRQTGNASGFYRTCVGGR